MEAKWSPANFRLQQLLLRTSTRSTRRHSVTTVVAGDPTTNLQFPIGLMRPLVRLQGQPDFVAVVGQVRECERHHSQCMLPVLHLKLDWLMMMMAGY